MGTSRVRQDPGSAQASRPPASGRALSGYALALVGVVLLFLGWYGVSGKALVEEQVPYLASATFPGVALVVAGAVLVAGDRSRRESQRAAEMVDALYELLTEPAPDEAATPDREAPAAAPLAAPSPPNGAVVAVGEGSRFHQASCPLVEGKASTEPVGTAEIAARGLEPCPVCDPVPPPG